MNGLLRELSAYVGPRAWRNGGRATRSSPRLANSLLVCAILTIVASSAACRSTSGVLRSERVDYKDRIVFSWSVAPRNVSIQIKNLGPGPILAELVLRNGATTKQELAEGVAPYFMLQNLTRVEFFHAAAGLAAVEWTIPADLHNEIAVRPE